MALKATLGRYRLGARIGEGGIGEVFVAELEGAEGFSRKVAIKRLRPELARSAEVAMTLVDEARLVQCLSHGGIVQILDVGTDDDGVPFLVTELVDGVSLAELVAARDQPLPIGVSLLIVEEVADALSHAHHLTDETGAPTPIIHRDVKPANVLLSRDGVVKLTDFGIGKAAALPSDTLPGMVKGTLGYLSLEQARGGKIDEATDQFSLGVVLHELLSGANPLIDAGSLVEYLSRLEAGLPRLVVDDAMPSALEPADADLADIVARATSVNPTDRFEVIAEFRDALLAWRVARDIKTSPSSLRDAVRAIGPRGSTAVRAALAAELDIASGPTVQATTAVSGGAGRPRARGIALVVVALAVAGFFGWRALEHRSAASAVEQPAQRVDAAQVAIERPSPPPSPDAAGVAGASAAIDASIEARDDASSAAPLGSAERAVEKLAPAKPGTIKVNVLPYAEVFINGKAYGETPVEASLPPGRYRVRLENPNRDSMRRSILVEAGKEIVITRW